MSSVALLQGTVLLFQIFSMPSTHSLSVPKCSYRFIRRLNYPNITWSSNLPHQSTFPVDWKDFLNFCGEFSLSQAVTQPTRITDSSAAVLDFVLTSPELISHITYLPGLSDQSLLYFFNVPEYRFFIQVERIFDYTRADFSAINNDLSIFMNDNLRGFWAFCWSELDTI